MVFGFLLALLYEKTGSIVPGILLHMLNNSVALLGSVAFAAVKSRLLVPLVLWRCPWRRRCPRGRRGAGEEAPQPTGPAEARP